MAADDLLKLAQDCFAQARVITNPDTKAELVRMGDQYLESADAMQRGQTAIHTVFPSLAARSGRNWDNLGHLSRRPLAFRIIAGVQLPGCSATGLRFLARNRFRQASTRHPPF
jgi:hypothetical protein